MNSLPLVRRWLALAGTVLVFALVLGVMAAQRSSDTEKPAQDESSKQGRDWTMFGGTQSRNLVNLVEKSIATKWNARKGQEKNVKWAVDLGSRAYGGPIIAGGKVFVGTNNGRPRDAKIKGDKGILMCFEEASGKFLWQAVHDKLEAGRVNDWPYEGICSSPAVEGDRLYYVNNRCEVVCADVNGLANGNQGVTDEKYTGDHHADVVWRLNMIDDLDVFPHNLAVCSPLIVGDVVYIITANGVDEGHINIPRPGAPSFIAVDKKSGKVLWKDNAPTAELIKARERAGKNVNIRGLVNQGLLLMHGQWSNPLYAEAGSKRLVIFPGGDGWIRAYDAKSHDLVWKFDCNPKGSVYLLGPEATRNDFVSTPVIWENKLYVGVGQDPEHGKSVGHLWCIDITKTPNNEEKDLTPVNNNFDPKAEVNKNSGLVWHYGGAAPANAQKNYLFARTMSTCAVHDGLCYAADMDGTFYCFDAQTGKLYYEHDLGADTWSSPYWVAGHVYIGNDNGKIAVFKHGKEKKLVSSITMRGKIRATPVAANGTLYVMTENPCRLYAIAEKK